MKFLWSVLPQNQKHHHNHNHNLLHPPPPPPPFLQPGSKDENFFDSQPWLESDCEDDYYSVRGDFTPSLGSTPVHHNFSSGNRPVTRSPSVEGDPSLPDKRKRLSELFKDSFHDNVDEATVASRIEAPAKVVPEPANPVHRSSTSTNGTPLSRCSAGKSPNRVPRADDNSVKAQCCLPRLLCYRLKETKKEMNPARNVG